MSGLSRRDAIRLAFGKGDQISLEREQESALDVMRGAAAAPSPREAPDPAAAPPRRSRLARFGARIASLFRRGA
jgi:hypothetical protein